MKPRFENSQNMLMAGIRHKHTYSEAHTSIETQWGEFVDQTPLKNQLGRENYGIMCANYPALQTFEYMTAVQVRNFDDLPQDFDRLIVEINRYAVFTLDLKKYSISEGWQFIWNEWLPISGYVGDDEAPEFEKYLKGTGPIANIAAIELWYPIRGR